MAVFGVRNGWGLCVMAVLLCACSRTAYGQVPTFDKTPCVENIYVAAGAQPPVANIAWVVPLATDKSGNRAAVTCDKRENVDAFEPGSTVVTCTAVDTTDTSSTAECTFNVHVLPKFEVGCPDAIIQNDTMVDFTAPTAVGSGGVAAVVQCTNNSGDSFDPGQTTVTCTATDKERSLEAQCSFDVTIGVPPTFDSNCTDLNVDTQPTNGKNEAESVMLPTTTATQQDGGVANVACRQADGSTTFRGGETNVTCTATDTNLPTLLSMCYYVVRVYPIFTRGCPDNMIHGNGSTVEFLMPVAEDSVGSSPNVTCNNPGEFVPGRTTVTCSATDSELPGQSVSCSFTVTIGKAPIFNPDPDCAQDVIVSPTSLSKAEVVTWPERTANQSDGTAARVECTPASGSEFSGGDNNVTCVATDTIIDTLTTTCDFKVRVYPKFVELCPTVVTRTPDPDDYGATIAYLNPVAEGQDGNDVLVTCSPQWGSKFVDAKTVVECIAEQSATENATCVTTVNVVPAFDVSTMVEDIDQGPDEGVPTAVVTWDLPTATAFEDEIIVKCMPPSGSPFEPGVSVVRCTASVPLPASKSEAEVVNKFKVRVFPQITCPDDVVDDPNPAAPNTTVGYPPATATDSTGSEVSVDCVPGSGSEFTNGIATNVTCNATDSVTGNEATCTFQVTVGEAPTFDDDPCHEQVNVPPDTDDGMAILVSWDDPTAVDRDNVTAVVTCSPASATQNFGPGPTEVTCTAVDGTLDSLISICTFNVFVSPTFNESCPEEDILVSPREAVVSPDWLRATGSIDTTGEPASVECDREAGSELNETTTMITCTGMDAGTMYTTNCSFTVTIDSSPPMLRCPEDETLSPDQGANFVNYTWTVNATDDYTPAEDIEVVCIPESGSNFKYGTTTKVICLAEDSVDNLGSCEFNVIVTGAECPENCSDNSACTINEDGDAVCECNEGFTGSPCKDINECEVDKPCKANADCTNLEPPEFYSCQCNEGFYGDGMYTDCQQYIGPEYPNITAPTELEKRFAVVLAVSNASSFACDPDTDKMSLECLVLVQTLKDLVESLYRMVSPRSFKAVTVDQSAITRGSVVIPHTVSYDYAYQEVRGIGPTEFLEKSTLGSALQAGAIGSLELVPDCTDCTDPKDITDVCTGVDQNSITCTGERVLDREESSDHCIFVCVSICVKDSDYCNGGVCSQATDTPAVCSECPEGFEGPTCNDPVEEEGPNIPLIVGLSVGLGGGALVIIIIGVAVYFYKKKKSKNTVSEFQEDDSRENQGVQLDSYSKQEQEQDDD